jgi:hypothetical protein
LAQVFTQWLAVPSNIEKGILRICYDTALRRAQERAEEDDFEKFMNMRRILEDDIQYWYHSRAFDSFIILFERSDGTILVSEDLKRVYLVVDVDIRITYKCIYHMTKDLKAVQKRAREVKKSLPFGPFCGHKVSLVLVPFKNMIVTDGSIFHRERLTPSHIKAAVTAYLNALDKNSLITQLPKLQPTLDYKSPRPTHDYIMSQKLENCESILNLRNFPRREKSVWWFSYDK